MRKFYFALAAILIVASVPAQVISGNFSICLPGPTTTQLTASVPPAPITATTPWFSSNPAVATISSLGLVTGLSFGTTTISYTDNLGSTYSVNVYVSTFPTINAPNGTSVCEAGILQLEGSLFPNAVNAWESLNTGIATVNSFGLVTGVAAGTVNILYRNLGGCTTTIPVTINPSLVPNITCGAITPTSITFNWTALPGASTYVRYSQLNGGPITSLGSDAPFTFTINNLSPQDQVTFYVVASGTSGNCFQAGQASCATTPCPNAGTDGFITICETSTASINLYSLITGEDIGGTWIRSSGSGGIFNAITGTFTPAPGSTTSNFIYTILGSNGCPADSSIATININQQPNAGNDGATTICDSSVTTIDLFSLITGEQTGGIWTRIIGTGGIFNAIAGTYTPTTDATNSIFEYRIVGVAPCVDDFSIVTVNINQQPDAGIDGCISVSDESPFIIDLYSLISGEQVGGTWTRTSGSGGTFDSLSATYVPAVDATTSTFSYSISGVAPCLDDSSMATLVINEQLGEAVTLFCDPANSTPNSAAFDWNNIGQTSFNFSYSINGGPTITGNTIVSNYQVFGVTPGQSITFTVQPVGNLCYSTTTTTCDLLSAVDFDSDALKYYPNPFNDVLNLSFSQSIESIQIFNILGQQVFNTNLRAKDFQINLSHLSKGTYLVKAISNDSAKIFKVIKD